MRKKEKMQGTCAKTVSFTYEEGSVTNIVFERGCDGMLKYIANQFNGWTPASIITHCGKYGTECGSKKTSCMLEFKRIMEELT